VDRAFGKELKDAVHLLEAGKKYPVNGNHCSCHS